MEEETDDEEKQANQTEYEVEALDYANSHKLRRTLLFDAGTLGTLELRWGKHGWNARWFTPITL